MSTQPIPSASAVVPFTQVTNPEISVSDKYYSSWDRFNEFCFYKAELKRYFESNPYMFMGEEDIILGIFESLFTLKSNEYHFEMFVDAVKKYAGQFKQ
jgi:hypothetical protein